MEIELNHLIAQFAQVPFKVQGVYRLSIEPGAAGWEKTAPYPGMIFPLKGQAQYHFDGTGMPQMCLWMKTDLPCALRTLKNFHRKSSFS